MTLEAKYVPNTSNVVFQNNTFELAAMALDTEAGHYDRVMLDDDDFLSVRALAEEKAAVVRRCANIIRALKHPTTEGHGDKLGLECPLANCAKVRVALRDLADEVADVMQSNNAGNEPDFVPLANACQNATKLLKQKPQ